MPIIRSLLDTDLHKLVIARAVAEKFPHAWARYRFFDRDPEHRFTTEQVCRIRREVSACWNATATGAEYRWLGERCPGLPRPRLDPAQVSLNLVDGRLDLTIDGPWSEATLWEVPLLAIINEVLSDECDLAEVRRKTAQKAAALEHAGCNFVAFGTRRRHSRAAHEAVVDALAGSPACIGVSNVALALSSGLPPVGGMAHEWVQGVSGLVGLRHANRFAMDAWVDVFDGWLGIALTDTFGAEAFWGDFDARLARLYDGVRCDSGDPFAFVDRAVKVYESHGIDPRTKTVVFSDGITVERAEAIHTYCAGCVRDTYSISTYLTNNVDGYVPPNIVIKLVEVDGVQVVKLSDSPGKVVGDEEAVRVARWTFGM